MVLLFFSLTNDARVEETTHFKNKVTKQRKNQSISLKVVIEDWQHSHDVRKCVYMSMEKNAGEGIQFSMEKERNNAFKYNIHISHKYSLSIQNRI